MNIGALFFIVTLVLGTPALGGVDGGNPTRQTFYNMAKNYRITNSNLIVKPVGSNGGIRLDGPLTYRPIGHFIIATEGFKSSSTDTLCRQSNVSGTNVTIFWYGNNCTHPYFINKFDDLVKSVHEFRFSK